MIGLGLGNQRKGAGSLRLDAFGNSSRESEEFPGKNDVSRRRNQSQ